MKRILSIILCVAMLSSMVAMSVSAFGDYVDQVDASSENVMTLTTDKTNYAAGDVVTITASMDSIWGSATIQDDFEGYEGFVMPGAYGMMGLTATLIYDTSVFTAQNATSLLSSSTILNADVATFNGSNLLDARASGSYNAKAIASELNSMGDAWGFLNGSGDLWQYKLKINANVADGTYYLPIGPYVLTDENGASVGKTPVIKFDEATDASGRLWAWLGQSTSWGNTAAGLGHDADVTFKTNYDGPSRVAADSPKGAEYECSYIKIVVGEDTSEQDKADAAAVDALIDAIGTVYNAGEVTKLDAINNKDIYTHIGDVSGSNFTVAFKMMPNGAGETYGFLGGVTTTGNEPRLFWNGAEKKFQIAKTNRWNNSSEVTEVLAESAVMDLPANKWTDVKFVYAGDNLSIVVNNETVCSYTYSDMPYDFYIFYPSQVGAYLSDAVVTGDFGTDPMADNFTHAAYSTVTLDSGAAITAASEAYEALSVSAKSYVTKKAVLDAAIAEYAAIAVANDQLYADRAIAAINAIGTPVLYPASGDAIVAAEALCATLTETQLGLVSNYATLTAARTEYNRQEVLFNQAKADYVIGLIDAIGEVTFESRAAIEAARDAYDLLTDGQKDLVTNYATLVAAEEAYALYGPVMNAENLINAIGTEFYQKAVLHGNFVHSNGYSVLKDKDQDNILFDLEFEFDFMYASANTSTNYASDISLFRGSKSNVGYDFKTGSFFVGDEGGWLNNYQGPNNIYASAEYELHAGRWYNMAISWTAAGLVTIKLDGEEVLTCDLATVGGDVDEYSYSIFYPHNVDLYIGDYTYTSVHWGWAGEFKDTEGQAWETAGVDVICPVDIQAKIEAAEAAVAVLTEDQAALLDASYTDALAAAKADVEAKVAELQAAADAVEAEIAAIETNDDIAAAQASYAALLPGAKTLVTNYADLQNANAKIVSNMIDALGTITPASADAIVAAENAYAALTNEEKALVLNYTTLQAARRELNSLNAAVANAEDVIALLQAGGSALKNVADDFSTGSYSQILDSINEDITGTNNHAPYTFSMDVLVESINAATHTVTIADEVKDAEGNVTTPAQTVDVQVAYIGWASGNSVFVAYDLVNSKFVVANNGAFKNDYAETLAGKNTVYAEAAYDLALNTWYNIEFVVEATYVEILVDGESVLKVDVDVNGYNIFYPVNNTAYYDNYRFSYNAGAEEESVSTFTRIDTATWVAHTSGAWTVATAPSVGAVKTDADLIANARAAFDAVPEKAQDVVANYDLLVEAEASVPVVDPNAEAAEAVDAMIDAIGEVTLDSEAAIVAAREAYAALNAEAAALVTKLATLEAAEAALADLKAAAEEAAKIDAVQAKIDALDVPATSVKNYADVLAAVDALVDAKSAYDALSAENQAKVDATELDAALAAYNKALVYDSVLNGGVAPAITAVTGGEGEITVAWDAVDAARKYWVYVDGVVVATTTATEITVPATAGDHKVKVSVAINETPALGSAATFVSGTSAEADVTVAAAVVTTLTAETTATENSITVTWNAVADNAIYYVTFNVGGTDIVVRAKGTSYTLANYVTADTDYTVTVKALIKNDKGTYDVIESEAVAGTTAEKAFKITSTDAGIVEWTDCEGATIYWVDVTKNGKTQTVRLSGDANSYEAKLSGECTIVVKAYVAGTFYATDAVTVVAE